MDWHKCAHSFIQIVENQSFAQAARSLYSSSSALSKHVNWLEEQLGVQLLQRTTRRLSLTTEGQCFYTQAKQLLSEWEQLKEIVGNSNNEPHGILTVGISAVFGNRYIVPLLPGLLTQYPRLKINLKTLTYPLSTNLEHLDLYFSHKPPDFFSEAMSHRVIGHLYLQIFASPSYLAQHGTPASLSALKDHNCLLSMAGNVPNEWEFEGHGKVQVQGNLIADNNGATVRAAAAGLGLIFTSRLALTDGLERHLVPVLPKYRSPRWTLYAYCPKLKALPLKTERFLQYIEEKLKNNLPSQPMA